METPAPRGHSMDVASDQSINPSFSPRFTASLPPAEPSSLRVGRTRGLRFAGPYTPHMLQTPSNIYTPHHRRSASPATERASKVEHLKLMLRTPKSSTSRAPTPSHSAQKTRAMTVAEADQFISSDPVAEVAAMRAMLVSARERSAELRKVVETCTEQLETTLDLVHVQKQTIEISKKQLSTVEREVGTLRLKLDEYGFPVDSEGVQPAEYDPEDASDIADEDEDAAEMNDD
ncbi:hypothetical protein SISNIDRAFT_465062 [Sistotremastrum niveocremeum HHB9708]|uniref:Uncharacterized protein n=1 Tax=Sistotremastrum niveocremeum HHB9708 TaxID=1314777 RepID=A0A164W742_9AGAM|nr:hypothetical protein SISNIDRAFT_465062 [Sistotremastrum niveocremeum HHB9708]